MLFYWDTTFKKVCFWWIQKAFFFSGVVQRTPHDVSTDETDLMGKLEIVATGEDWSGEQK